MSDKHFEKFSENTLNSIEITTFFHLRPVAHNSLNSDVILICPIACLITCYSSIMLSETVSPAKKLRKTRSTAVEDSSEKIKNYITQNNLSPGDCLPSESDLCTILNVSRSSVREALRRLEALQIVEVRRGIGAFVGSLSMSPLVETLAFRTVMMSRNNLEGLREIVKVRRYLDLGMAQKVCDTLKGIPQPGLETLVELMERRAKAGKLFSDEDYAFHDGILALLNNEVMRQLVGSFWKVNIASLPQLGTPSTESLITTATSHRAMLDAAVNGDVHAYRQAVMQHYAPVEQTLHLT